MTKISLAYFLIKIITLSLGFLLFLLV